jgi:hypothetical protein
MNGHHTEIAAGSKGLPLQLARYGVLDASIADGVHGMSGEKGIKLVHLAMRRMNWRNRSCGWMQPSNMKEPLSEVLEVLLTAPQMFP